MNFKFLLILSLSAFSLGFLQTQAVWFDKSDKILRQFKSLFVPRNHRALCEKNYLLRNNPTIVSLARAIEYWVCIDRRKEQSKIIERIIEHGGNEFDSNIFDKTDWSRLDDNQLKCVAKLYQESKDAETDRNGMTESSGLLQLKAGENFLSCMTMHIPHSEDIIHYAIENVAHGIAYALYYRLMKEQRGRVNSDRYKDSSRLLQWYKKFHINHPTFAATADRHVYIKLRNHYFMMLPLIENKSEFVRDIYVRLFKSIFDPLNFDLISCLGILDGLDGMPHAFIEMQVCKRRLEVGFEKDLFDQSEWSKLNPNELDCVAQLYGESLQAFGMKLFPYKQFLACKTPSIPYADELALRAEYIIKEDQFRDMRRIDIR